MREEYIRYIINEMCKFYGYGVITIDNTPRLQSNWALIKNIKYNEKRVIIFREANGVEDDSALLWDLKLKLNCENMELIKVSLVEAAEDIVRNASDESSLVCVEYKKGKIIQYGQRTYNVAQEIANIMYNNQVKLKERKESFKSWVTYGIIGINIIVYIFTALLSQNIFDSDINVLIYLGAKYNPLIRSGEFYRLVTCMFLHGGIVHLGLNMYALYSIGPLVERIYGRTKYIIIYFVSGIISSLFSFMFSEGVSIGASGAIFGLLGTVLIFAIKMKETIGRDFLRNIASVIIANLILGFTIPNIDNFGHLGGLIGGALLGYLMKK